MAQFTAYLAVLAFIIITSIFRPPLVLGGDSSSLSGYRVDGSFTTMKFAMGRLIVAGHGETMINLKTGHLWITGFKKAVYWEGTVEEFCRLQRRNWLVYVAEMRRRMADKSPEELASTPSWVRSHMADIEQRLQRMGMGDDKGARSLNVVVEENPERTTIASQSAQKYRVLVDGKLYEEVWLTTDPALAREAALQDAPETWGRYLACVQHDFGGVEETREYRQKFSLGLPLKVVSYRYFENSDADSITTHLAFSIDPIEVREEEFAPPADFKKVSLEELGD